MSDALRTSLEPFVLLALAGVHREWPVQLAHRWEAEEIPQTPREHLPVFYGCYDWHSSVHGHWLLARAARHGVLTQRAKAALAASFAEDVATEVHYLRARPSFERPYGLAWLLRLQAELEAWAAEDTDAAGWAARLGPLVEVAEANLTGWLGKLHAPTRSGTHANTAFALGLMLESGRQAPLVRARAHAFYGDDEALPLHLEPGGEDFLSPTLTEADLMCRVLEPAPFARWLDGACPTLGRGPTLTPVTPADRSDGRLAHLDGLNLSRAWMARRIARAVPSDDARREALGELADAHGNAGLAAIAASTYAGTHWLGTFATYLLTAD
ncbi:MAG: DUF2891 domain-containing protein [Myxococcota bacterium]